MDRDPDRLHRYLGPGARQFMRRYAVDLLRREDWRRLLDLAAKPLTRCAQLFEGQIQRQRLSRLNAVRI